ncbi:Non-repetitive/WGA-negative nucleoporin C-terminal-domain-containing protein [Clohesyomyces aquaticus]|uniref:Non-repetitive/WGA-negative nucleoporin C-terminal-domain-containing protein n=1 Tax=Clohesyomyces aquaticus TaxID=1231657 RepID=A0A1Y1Z0Z4_9PLEO|nr:Non-repetitive/WGA-negative nucleoporin C-terminal-domain-containing protein [Clohesyomyces aquaticus]
MFSPEATIHSARSSGRNPRRRQRKDSDSGRLHPQRKRSKLSDDSFASPSDAHANGNSSLLMNGHASSGDVDGSLVLVNMPVRDRKPPKRGIKDDASILLTKNDNYSVKKLPSFPAELSNSSIPFRAFTLPSAGFALALTSTHALAWDYTAPHVPTKTLTLPLPFGLKPSDPLPLGAVVRNGPTNEFGVLALAPSSGKITFWENVDSAETRSHFPQRHQGVDGSVGKLYSGEVITGLVDIEHAGYIIIFSSGRLAQLTLRDSQGRPSITVNALQTPSSSGGSFFSFTGFLGSTIRKAIASVKSRASTSKGQMEVIAATKNGVFRFWDLSWTGQQVFKKEVDMYTQIIQALEAGTAPELRGQHEAHILDFAIMEPEKEQGIVSLLVLVALSGRNSLDHSLLEIDLSGNAGMVSRAIPLRTLHETQLSKEPTGTLLLPYPGHTALVQLSGAIVVASVAEPEESPDAQLLSDSGRPSLPFQDTIYFRQDRHVHFSGYGLERNTRKDRQSSALVFVQGYGILHISTLPPATDDEQVGRHKVTARSKLEQATFFSTVPGNVIDFSIKSRYTFGQEETENAAEEISFGILSSSFDFIEKVAVPMEEQMSKRSDNLRNLISHLRSDYPPLSFKVTWQLLWNAEKLAAARQLWRVYEARLRDQEIHPDAYLERPLICDLVRNLHERYKTPIRPELGETDPVRQFFVKDIHHLEIILPWAWQTLRMFYIDKKDKTRAAVMQRLSEADDVVISTLETGVKFRVENIENYGLDPDSLRDGVLKPGKGYDLLPQFWTSTHNLVSCLRSLSDVGRNMAAENFEQGTREEQAMKIGRDNARMVKLCCQSHIERSQWMLEHSDPRKVDAGMKLRAEYDIKVQPLHIYGLLEIGLVTEAMNLAENYRDMPTLARLIWDEHRYLTHHKATTSSKMEEAECQVKLNRISERISRYFDTYGEDWAEAYYSRYIAEHKASRLFMKDIVNQTALTKFLRADPSRAKLSWINSVLREKDYKGAGAALFGTWKKQESNAWCKKVELSISKLSLLAQQQEAPSANDSEADLHFMAMFKKTTGESELSLDLDTVDPVQRLLSRAEEQLEYAGIQDKLYQRIQPIVSGALDSDSAIQLLIDEFGQGKLTDRPAHQQLLRQGFEDMINNRVMEPALLVDVLTLMTYEEGDAPRDALESNEFAFALRALALSWNDMDRTTRDSTLRIIWKRLLIRDDWAAMNTATFESDLKKQEHLAYTWAGWTYQNLLRMLEANSVFGVIRPGKVEDYIGAGCTNGELCIRFGSEDLRSPIINDNLADDEILQANIEKHGLVRWFDQAAVAAREFLEVEKERIAATTGVAAVQAAAGGNDDDMYDSESESASANAEASASDVFEGDDEQSGQDVEMQDDE